MKHAWMALALALAINGCAKQEDPRPPFTAYTQVVGDSMLPSFASGEVVRVELCDFSQVGAGDTVIFWHDGIRGFVHHRLVQRDPTGLWVTAGDNNPGIDRGHMDRSDFVGRTSKFP